MSNRILTLTDENLQIHIQQHDEPVLVDFWAAWCGPCRAIAPTLEELGRAYAGRATIGKLNVDEHPSSASRYHVRAIPTLILFSGGQERDRLVGAQSKKVISELLDFYLHSKVK